MILTLPQTPETKTRAIYGQLKNNYQRSRYLWELVDRPMTEKKENV